MISQIKEINFPEYATLSQATVTINDMGDRTITARVDIDGSVAPDFSYDWEVEFKGERYIQPLRQPQAGKSDEYRRSKIDLVFYHWAVWQLKRYYFVEMTSTESGTAVADRYIASLGLNLRDFCIAFNKVLDYYFDGQITLDLNPQYDAPDGVQYVGISYSYIWDVLQSMYEIYGARWDIESTSDGNYTIKVGYEPTVLDHIFQYGYDGGLLKIERQVQDANIRNSLLGRGGEQNLPAYYFKEAPEGSLFASDPDAIPELANIYFSNLRGKTFRDYVKGWKAAHYGGEVMSNPTEEYTKGYTDEKFNPIEYVKDDASIAKYGLLQGALENNENIYPSIQGTEGEVNTVVYVEPILTDEVNPEITEVQTIKLPSISQSENISKDAEGSTFRYYLRSENFTVPEGEYALVIGNSATYNISYWFEMKYEGNPLVSVFEFVYNAETGEEVDKNSLSEGTYYVQTIFEVRPPVVSDFGTSIGLYRTITVATNLELRELQTDGSDTWKPTFDIWVKNIWNSYRSSDESDEQYADRVWKPILGDRKGTVCFSSGWLARNDYDFIIVDYAFDDTKSYQGVSSEWRLTLAKSDAELEATGKYIPSASTNGQAYAGDTFYFIGIDMPYEYVYWAEEALDSYKYAELWKVSEIQPKWVVTFDKIRIHEDSDNLIDSIVAGGMVSITDKRFNPDSALALYVTSVTYNWNDNTTMLPDVEVVLADRVTVAHNPVAQMQSSIELLQSQVGSMASVPQLIRSICDKLYLRKDGLSDTSLSPTKFSSIISGRNFSQGMVGGTDWGIYKDGNGRSVAEFDKLVVRNEMTVNNLVVNQITAVGGTQIMSAAAIECSRVIETEDGYECFFEQKEGTVANMFSVDDIAYSQVFNPEGYSLKYYKRVVTAITDNSITLSKTNADGEGVPMAGDNIVQFGNLSDVQRQSFIVIEPLNGGSIKVFAGVNSFTLDERNYVGLGVNPTTNRAYLYGYGDMFFGDRNLESNFITYQIPDPTEDNPNPEPILVINADVQLGAGSMGLSNLSEYKDLQDQIENAGDVHYYTVDPTLENEPAATWVAEGKEADHINAIYNNTETGESWRWVEENGVYKWKPNVNPLEYLKNAFPKDPTLMSNGLILASMVGVWDENKNPVAGLYGGGSNELNVENGLWDSTHGAMLVFGGLKGTIGESDFDYNTAIFEDGFIKSKTFATATEGARVEIFDNRIYIHGDDANARIEIGYDEASGQPILQYIDQNGNHAWSAGEGGISNAVSYSATTEAVNIHAGSAPAIVYNTNLGSWEFTGNLVVTGGLAAYSTLDSSKVISVFEGLPIDGQTLIWKATSDGDKILVVNPDIIGGGGSGDVGEITSDAIIAALGYTPYDGVSNPLGFLKTITSSQVTSALGFTPFDKDNFTKSNIKSTLGISDWALASSLEWSAVNNRPTKLSQFTDDVVSGKYLAIGGTATDSSKLGGVAATYYSRWADTIVASSSYKHIGYGYSSDGWYTTGPAAVFGVSNYKAALQFRWTDSHFYAGYGYETDELSNWKQLAYISDTVDAAKKLSSNSKEVYYSSAKDAWVLEGNLVVSGGLATYTKLAGWEDYGIMEAIETDETTISKVGGVLHFIGETGGLDEEDLDAYLSDNSYYNSTTLTKSVIKTKLGISDWALASTKPSYTWDDITSKPSYLFYSLNAIVNPTDTSYRNVSGYAYSTDGGGTTGVWASFYSNNYLAQMQFNYGSAIPFVRVYDYSSSAWSDWKRIALHSTFDNYVPLATAKDITAIHNFVNGVKIGGKAITYDSTKDAIILPTNVVIEGGLATYTKLSGFEDLDVMGGIVTDGTTIHVNDAGQLEVIGGGGGGDISITGAASTIVSSNLTVSRALISNSSGKVAVSAVTSTELGYLDGVTSAIQTQLNNKQATLVSGTNIKTINGTSILGSGNITISGSITDEIDGPFTINQSSFTNGLILNRTTSAGPGILFKSNGSNVGIVGVSASGKLQYQSYASSSASLVWSIDVDGNMDVIGGVSMPSFTITEHPASSAFDEAQIRFGTDSIARIGVGSTGNMFHYGRHIYLRTNGTTSASTTGAFIDTAGNMTITGALTENSDRKLKNVEYEGDGLELADLKKIKVAKWHWKDKRDERLHIGGVADNLAEIMPEVVFESEDENGVITSSIAYGKAGFSVAASLIAPVSRHEDKIAELEKSIEQMQKELKNLKKKA